MANGLARTYVVLSGAILVVVGIVGFYRHEMFHLTFPPAHNLFHLLSGLIALWMGLGGRPNGVREFGLIFGAIYVLLAIAGFAGLKDLGSIELGLNSHYNVIHLGIGVLSLAAGFSARKERGRMTDRGVGG
jgi:hypothetical protein